MNTSLDGGFKYFLCSTLPGEDSHFDLHIFQRGWFNHQLAPLFSEKFSNTKKHPIKVVPNGALIPSTHQEDVSLFKEDFIKNMLV